MESNDNEEVKKDYTRVGYAIVLCIVASYVWEIFFLATVLIIFVQILMSLLNDQPNQQIVNFTRSLGTVISGGFAYAFFLTDEKPFPFSSWPTSGDSDTAAVEAEAENDVLEQSTESSSSEDDDQKSGEEETASSSVEEETSSPEPDTTQGSNT